MSTSTTTKSDKKESKQKFSTFNINTLYKGKSLENPKTSGKFLIIFDYSSVDD